MKNMLITVIAVLFAVIGAMGLKSAADRRIEQVESQVGQRTEVVIAEKAIPAGAQLTRELVGTDKIFRSTVEADGYIIDAGELESIMGERTAFDLYPKQPIRWTDLQTGKVIAPEARIPIGFRAVSVSVSSATGVSGLVRPNSRVDVIVNVVLPVTTGSLAAKETMTLTLLQNVPVIAVGRQVAGAMHATAQDRSGERYSTVTLLVTPEQAEWLVATQLHGGTVSCILRNPDDSEMVELDAVSLGDVVRKASKGKLAGVLSAEPPISSMLKPPGAETKTGDKGAVLGSPEAPKQIKSGKAPR